MEAVTIEKWDSCENSGVILPQQQYPCKQQQYQSDAPRGRPASLRNGPLISQTSPLATTFGVVAVVFVVLVLVVVVVAFDDVQRDRLRGPKQLVPRVAINIPFKRFAASFAQAR